MRSGSHRPPARRSSSWRTRRVIRSAAPSPSTATDRAADGPGPRFAYNLDPTPAGFSDIVLVVDADADTPATGRRARTAPARNVAGTSRSWCCRVTVRSRSRFGGPAFGSYAADEVGWLLTDISSASLEAPVEEREEAIQVGGAHYAESLPIEYRPDARYRALFDEALDDGARRIARAVGVVTEVVLAERGRDVVLASLARAGTPVGVLMRRWAAFAHGLTPAALRPQHRPRPGCGRDGARLPGRSARGRAGRVRRRLDRQGRHHPRARRRARRGRQRAGRVVRPVAGRAGGPGSCVRTFGTREDFLVPSACLNSTVSGLVSRTVLNADVLAPGQFHGAKFYADLAAEDVSARFVDAISDRSKPWPTRWRSGGRSCGRRTHPHVRRLVRGAAAQRRVRIGDVNSSSRGSARRRGCCCGGCRGSSLVRAGAERDVAHIRLLAEQRGVQVREVAGLTYRSVGLIHPRFSRGATGADGRAASR